MKAYVQIDDTKVLSLVFSSDLKLDGMVEVEVPDELVEDGPISGYNVTRLKYKLFDCSVENGQLTYTGEGTRKVKEEQSSQLLAFKQKEQVIQFAKYKVSQTNFEYSTSDEVVQFKDLWPNWEPDTEYGFQQPLRWKGKYYRTSKVLTSSLTYPPDIAGESEYYPIEVANDGVIVYRTCHGQYDSVRFGERRHYPDEDGPIYTSIVDYNSNSPEVRPQDWQVQ